MKKDMCMYSYHGYEYDVRWGHEFYRDEGDRWLIHIITLPNGTKYNVHFDPKGWMSRRDFERLVDYFEAKGGFPVHLLPEEPLRNGEPSYFCAIAGVA
jgi:hypothetical protein